MPDQGSLSNVSNATLVEMVHEIQPLLDKMEGLRWRTSAAFKKWEERGIPKAAAKRYFKLRREDDQNFIADERILLRLMALDGFKITEEVFFAGLDLSRLGPEDHAAHRVWLAQDVGYQVGIAGGTIETNQFQAGTEEFVAWERGFRSGQETLLAAQPEKTEIPSARKNRHGAEAAPVPSAAAPPRTESDDEWEADGRAAAARMEHMNRADAGEETGLGIPNPDDDEFPVEATRAKAGRAPERAPPAAVGAPPKRRGRPPKSATTH